MKSSIIASTFLLLCAAVFAETIYLKGGDRITGKIAREDKESIRLRTPYGDLLIPRRDIEKIDKTEKVKVCWRFKTKAPSFGSGAAGDIDGDGKLEIVFGTYFNDSQLYALNGEDGSELWKAKSAGGPIDASVTIADVNGDDKLEVLYADSANGLMSCLNGKDGSLMWKYKSRSGTDSPGAVADVDGDGKPEIVYGTMWSSKGGGFLTVLNGEDGTELWTYQIEKGCIQSEPAILDVNDDGQLDIIFTDWRGSNCVYALNGRTGKLIWKYQAGGWMYHGVGAADLDGDKKPEIVFCPVDGVLHVLNGKDGSVKWRKMISKRWTFAPVSLGDLDSDGKIEIITAVYGIHVFRHDGKPYWRKKLACGSPRGVSLADLTGDDKPEIIFGGKDRKLRIWCGTDGKELASFDATCGKDEHEGIDNAPVIADFNGDGASDLFFVSGKGTSGNNQPRNYGCAYLLSWGKGKGKWMTFRHDNRRSGCAGGPFIK